MSQSDYVTVPVLELHVIQFQVNAIGIRHHRSIIIPDTAKEKPLHGKIVATGNGTKDEEMILKEGDEVLYGKYSGTELEFEGTKYLMMRQSDVLAILG